MPVEIREVLLRARIAESDDTPTVATIDLEELKQEIMIECEEKIRDVLRRQSER